MPRAPGRALTTMDLPVLLLFYGILLGWVVRLGLGVHAYWSYRRNPRTLTMELSGKSAEQ